MLSTLKILPYRSNILIPTSGQGTVIKDGRIRIEEYIAHRKQREADIFHALSDIGKEATSMELVKVVYKDVPENLHVPAAKGVVQVLRKLEGEGKVVQCQHERWQTADIAKLASTRERFARSET